MKAWVTSTLGSSLKLINEKLEEVDQKAKMTTNERAELEQLRLEKLRTDKEKAKKGSKESSSEKGKRMGARTPVENSPSAARVKSRSRPSTKTRPKRIEILDDEGVAGVKQNLEPKMESSSELADIKQMLAALLQGLSNPKGKEKVVEPQFSPPVAMGEEEDTDVVQNANVEDDEEIDDGGLAAYMKIRLEYYNSSLHYTRVQELCKAKNVQYFRKEMGVWELARIDLQEYTDTLSVGQNGECSRKQRINTNEHASATEANAVKEN
ncbi:hypothetical protein CBR_g6276 [Chara braunii]|uniref:Uncharacterized protein n=1 Tax=Chara braunii TaxID=69332 RepID=A0A388KJA5_CHABU|nr:hypothetical protein CBR_g6276 [Chara braunii]|eukprot:GBG70145.1 hypothetical protein CBR_g6276 [Chara braunii]